MRRFICILLLAVILAAINSCIPSVHPLYTEDDLIMDESILGQWKNKSEDVTWEILKVDENTYGVILTADSVPALFLVHMVKLGEAYFLDFYPEEFDLPEDHPLADFEEYDCINYYHMLHLFRVHTFARLDKSEDHLEIRRFNMDWLDKLFTENKIRIAHERTEDNILLTASTEELQSFVSKYADDKEAYVEREYLVRVE